MGTATNSPPRHGPRKRVRSLKRIGWLYPIFRGLHFYRGLLRPPPGTGTRSNSLPTKSLRLWGGQKRIGQMPARCLSP